MERFAIVMPTLSESSVTLIFRFASITSRLMIMGTRTTSYRQVVLGLHVHGVLHGPFENGHRGRDHDREEGDDDAHHHPTGAIFIGVRKDDDFGSRDENDEGDRAVLDRPQG